MAFINIYAHNEAHISVINNQLVLKNAINQESFPLEDVNCLVVESLKSNFSLYAINALVQNKTLVLLCDEKHLPASAVLPFNNYYKPLMVYKAFTSAKEPTIKNIWKNIIVQKIANQALVAQSAGSIVADKLFEMSKDVKSDDSQNQEAAAASCYFKAMFGKNFTRDQNILVNSALNYCYAILRGAIARTIAAHGLQPFMGIHHKSELNAFNLADDFIEPFRPTADSLVLKLINYNQEESLTPHLKKELLGILNADVLIDNKMQPINHAIEVMVASFVVCLQNNFANIILPKFVGCEMHQYE